MTELTTRGGASAPAPAPATRTGRVAFVGAGPGDPALLTLRAVEHLAAADLVMLASPTQRPLLQHCRADVEVVDGAADSEGAPLTAAARGKLMTASARTGGQVVRLVDGDPAMYAGLSDEAAACRRAKVPFEIVPGVPAISAVPAYAGIPLASTTSRELRVIDARRLGVDGVDWAGLAAGDATLVILDGLDRIGTVAAGLVAGGRAATTPIAVTAEGTTARQQTVVSTLERVAEAAAAAGIAAPTVTVVGDVVGLRDKLSWFESKPLFGWRVLVPRTREQAGPLSTQLAAYGAVPEEVPTIAVEPPRSPHQLERAIKGLVTGRYSWIAFTSRNAVRAVRERFEAHGLDARAFSGLKVAAVGEASAADLVAWGIRPDLVPAGEQSSAGLLEDWPAYDPVFDPINRVFLPRADIATETLVAGLRELGWEVDDVTAYRTVRASPPPAEVRDAIKAGGFDAVVFTSSSTVRNLVGIAGKPHPGTVIACIGPQTAATAQEHGLQVHVVSPTPSMADLAAALADYGAAQDFTASSNGGASDAGKPGGKAGMAGKAGKALRPSERRAALRRKSRDVRSAT